jgi:hypothetical protein
VEHSAILAHQSQPHQVTLEERIAESSQKDSAGKKARRGGRKAAFEETQRIALFLPPDAVAALRVAAASRGITISALVAELAQGL